MPLHVDEVHTVIGQKVAVTDSNHYDVALSIGFRSSF
uniref:Uncharacterized protein n=1 Tax=Anguilla anguilla TaxID=7936 RepID=A0A0E9PHR4_ANGAN